VAPVEHWVPAIPDEPEDPPVPYLDYAASAPLRAEALDAMRPFLERPAANPSSQHRPGRAARAAVEHAREQVAALVGATPGQVVFTSGGTEADNLAVKGTVLAAEPGARHLVCSAVEHHAVLDAAAAAAADLGAEVELAPVDAAGRVDLERLARLPRPGRTALVAVMAANNEVGTVQPVARAAELAHAAGAVLLCDAVQAAGLPGVHVGRDAIDLLALAAHKLGGPTGIGALVVRPGLELRPLHHGGGQERGVRSGTLPAAAIAGFGAAAEAALTERLEGSGEPRRGAPENRAEGSGEPRRGAPENRAEGSGEPRRGAPENRAEGSGEPGTGAPANRGAENLARLRDRLLAGLRRLVPDLEVNGDPTMESRPGLPVGGLPGLLSVRFPGRRAEDLLLLLDRAGVACSAGSACASGAVAASHVLLAMGRSPAAARETVRFSLGHASTQADVDDAVTAVGRAVQVLAPAGVTP
jgi:cysteine desulfurase